MVEEKKCKERSYLEEKARKKTVELRGGWRRKSMRRIRSQNATYKLRLLERLLVTFKELFRRSCEDDYCWIIIKNQGQKQLWWKCKFFFSNYLLKKVYSFWNLLFYSWSYLAIPFSYFFFYLTFSQLMKQCFSQITFLWF